MTKESWIILDIEAAAGQIEFRLEFDIVNVKRDMALDDKGFLLPHGFHYNDSVWRECESLGLSRETTQALSREYVLNYGAKS